MKKAFTILIYIFSILIPLFLVFNFKSEEVTVEVSDHSKQEEIINIADSVIIKIEETKKKQSELHSEIQKTESIINKQNKQITKLKNQPKEVEIVHVREETLSMMIQPIEVMEMPQPESLSLEIDNNEELKSQLEYYEIENQKLKLENQLLKDTLQSLRQTNIWNRALKKLNKLN